MGRQKNKRGDGGGGTAKKANPEKKEKNGRERER